MAGCVVRASLSQSLLKNCLRNNSGGLYATLGRHGSRLESLIAFSTVPAAKERQIPAERFILDPHTINPNLKRVQYAVRGPVLDRAMQIERELAEVRGKACENSSVWSIAPVQDTGPFIISRNGRHSIEIRDCIYNSLQYNTL